MEFKSEKNIRIPKLSIGLPVYNGGEFIAKTLDNILSQTFTDFELIISDNHSTDQTSKICHEYTKKDKRISYFYQEKNIGVNANFLFILNKATSEYFKWWAADDIYHPTFLEKSISLLELKKDAVGCISKVNWFGPRYERLRPQSIDPFIIKFKKKIQLRMMTSLSVIPLIGSTDQRIRKYMKKLFLPILLYGVYRRKGLHENLSLEFFVNNDSAMVLNALKHGNFYILDEVLMQYYSGGSSRSGMIPNMKEHYGNNYFKFFFPLFPFTSWFLRKLGFKNFLKNFYILLFVNCVTEIFLLIQIFNLLKKKI